MYVCIRDSEHKAEHPWGSQTLLQTGQRLTHTHTGASPRPWIHRLTDMMHTAPSPQKYVISLCVDTLEHMQINLCMNTVTHEQYVSTAVGRRYLHTHTHTHTPAQVHTWPIIHWQKSLPCIKCHKHTFRHRDRHTCLNSNTWDQVWAPIPGPGLCYLSSVEKAVT